MISAGVHGCLLGRGTGINKRVFSIFLGEDNQKMKSLWRQNKKAKWELLRKIWGRSLGGEVNNITYIYLKFYGWYGTYLLCLNI